MFNSPYSFRPTFLFISGLLPLLFLMGCTESKPAQCQKLILITKGIADQASQRRNSIELSEMLAIAAAFDDSAKKVEKLKLDNPQLRIYQQSLKQIYSDNAAVTRIMVRAIEDKDIPTAKSAQEKVKTVGEQERTVITQMNQYCQLKDG